jgi:N-formylglutamate deformylase
MKHSSKQQSEQHSEQLLDSEARTCSTVATSPLFVTIPHSGEKVPEFCTWLHGLPEEILMCDVDRFVDRLYEPSLKEQGLPFLKTDWHRYAADLNRIPGDIDQDSVEGNNNPSGSNDRGFHWVVTTYNHRLMPKPMPLSEHQKLVQLIYEPFHESVRNQYEKLFSAGHRNVYHIDAHSMPSKGTKMHRDPGETRADIVVSDCKGKSCDPEFVDLVISSYARAGFKVAYNWPYFGGRVSEQYGAPAAGKQALQVEMNRALYMDEITKKWLPEKAEKVQRQLSLALERIRKALPLA